MQFSSRTFAIWITTFALVVQAVVPVQAFGCGCRGACASTVEPTESACGCCQKPATNDSKVCCCSGKNLATTKSKASALGAKTETQAKCSTAVDKNDQLCGCGVEQSVPALPLEWQQTYENTIVLLHLDFETSSNVVNVNQQSQRPTETPPLDATAPASAQVLFCIWLT